MPEPLCSPPPPPPAGYRSYGAAATQYSNISCDEDSDYSLESDPFFDDHGETVELCRSIRTRNTNKGALSFTLADVLAMIIVFFGPLVIFGTVYMLTSFYVHYKFAALGLILIVVIFAVVIFIGYCVIIRMTRDSDGVSDHFAVWAAALFVGVFVGFFAALLCGSRNYGRNMHPYYEWTELSSYIDVDPSSMRGDAFADAGVLKFTAGSYLDVAKSMGVMSDNMYCIAPIVSTSGWPDSVDFWAIGLNCCTEAADSFACGDSAKTNFLATGGLRLVSEREAPFYHLALTQAVTKYGIKSSHPIFVYAVQDTAKVLEDYEIAGWASVVPAQTWFLVFQALVVAIATMGVRIVKSKYV